jgi:ubiquinone/menaquinone biosynthesis C-methylase UbiE
LRKTNRSYYDEYSHWYENKRHEGYHAMIDELESDLLKGFVEGKDCLEVGCGTGLIMKRIENIASSVVGIDISPGMLEKARERGLSVMEGCATELPFEDASFDVVYSFKVLAHVEDIQGALAEMARVTRPGGKLLMEFYNPMSLRYLAKSVAGPQKISQQTHEGAVYTRWDRPVDLKAHLPEGVRIVDYAGVRIFTPAAVFHRIPVVHTVLRQLEFVGRDSPLKYFGGFLVAIAEKG